MAISSIQAVLNYGGVAATSPLPAPFRASPATQAPLVASPGSIVTVGANNPAPLVYNSAGLLQSLIQLKSSTAFPSGPAPGSAAARLQDDPGLVLGLNTNTNSGSSGLTANLPVGTAQALDNVLTNSPDGAAGIDQNQVLGDLLAQATGFSVSGLGLAATALNTNAAAAFSANPVLAQLARDTSVNSAFNNEIDTRVTLASANLNNGNDDVAVSGTPSQILNDVILSALRLSTATTGSAASGANSSGLGSAQLSAGTVPPQLANGRTSANADARTAAISGSANQPQPVSTASQNIDNPPATGIPATLANATISEPAGPATGQLRDLLNDPSASAINSVKLDPGYAAAVATLYLSAAIFRSQTNAVNVTTNSSIAQTRPVSGVQSIRAVKVV